MNGDKAEHVHANCIITNYSIPNSHSRSIARNGIFISFRWNHLHIEDRAYFLICMPRIHILHVHIVFLFRHIFRIRTLETVGNWKLRLNACGAIYTTGQHRSVSKIIDRKMRSDISRHGSYLAPTSIEYWFLLSIILLFSFSLLVAKNSSENWVLFDTIVSVNPENLPSWNIEVLHNIKNAANFSHFFYTCLFSIFVGLFVQYTQTPSQWEESEQRTL